VEGMGSVQLELLIKKMELELIKLIRYSDDLLMVKSIVGKS